MPLGGFGGNYGGQGNGMGGYGTGGFGAATGGLGNSTGNAGLGGFGGVSSADNSRDGYSPSSLADRRGQTVRDGVAVAVGNEARDSWGSKAKGAVVGSVTGTGIVGSWGTQSVIGALAQQASQSRVTGEKGAFGSALADQSGLSGLSGKIGAIGSGGTVDSSQMDGLMAGLSEGDRDTFTGILKNLPTNEAKAAENPDQTVARITREQWSHYLDNYGPLEQEMAGQTKYDQYANQAKNISYRQNDNANQSLVRNLDRYGVNMEGAQKNRMQRNTHIGGAEANVFNVANARLAERDRNEALSGDLLQLGRGISGQGISGLGDVAGMAAQRNAANAQAEAQASAQRSSSVTNAIGTGVSAYLGGASPWAAAGLGALGLFS